MFVVAFLSIRKKTVPLGGYSHNYHNKCNGKQDIKSYTKSAGHLACTGAIFQRGIKATCQGIKAKNMVSSSIK